MGGDALDEKTPLLRAMKAVDDETTRLLKLLGYSVGGVQPNIGLEQEYFLVPRSAFYKRMDLQLTGRTIMGKNAPRGQEMCDHYMGPPNQIAMACIQEIQHECFMMGISMRTRHREVAPNQYENAPFFGTATTQIDQNLMFMQIAEEVSARHGLACLMHEKPFAGINGSGKHNNISLGTTEGVNLLNVGQLQKASGSSEIFPVLMAGIISAVDTHGDLMRMAIASPGNDFCLGACEAPPAIVSTYLGDDITAYLEKFMAGDVSPYEPNTKTVDLGIPSIAPFTVPAEDRNRTSPFPYGGHRFEFRAVGSSQNVSLVNTVLNAITAKYFATISDRIEAGEKPVHVAQDLLKKHYKVIFNGNGYDPKWPIEAGKRGVWRIDSGVEAINKLVDPKNVAMFKEMGVFDEEECAARREILLEGYIGTIEMEVGCMIDMINQYAIPSAKAAGINTSAMAEGVTKLKAGLAGIHAAKDNFESAKLCRILRLETMIEVRKTVDEVEAECPANLWSYATYKELLFLDSGKFK